MSRKGTCLYNSPIENFFGVLKQEMYYGRTYSSFEELERRIDDYIYYYNNKRIKSKLGYMSPTQFRLLNDRSIA
jgi:putative transposase